MGVGDVCNVQQILARALIWDLAGAQSAKSTVRSMPRRRSLHPLHHVAASLLLHLAREQADPVSARVLELGCEVHGPVSNGKMIVTLESDNEQLIGECLNALQLLPGVYAATLVFHHVETLAPDADMAATEDSQCA